MFNVNRNVVGALAIAAAICFGTARSAQAVNVLANPMFASTTNNATSDASAGSGIQPNYWPTSWTTSGGTSGVGNDWFFGVHLGGGPTGENVMEAFHTTSLGTLSQTFATSAGTTYFLSFIYNSGDTVPSVFSIALTNASNFNPSLPNGNAPLAPSGWVFDVFSFQANSTSSTITFGMQDQNSNVEIADLDIDTTIGRNPVPLPPSFYMSLPAAAGAGWYFLRRKLAAAALVA